MAQYHDEEEIISCIKAIIGAPKMRSIKQKKFKQFDENWVVEPKVKIYIEKMIRLNTAKIQPPKSHS